MTENDAEKACQFLVDTAHEAGRRKAAAQLASNSLRRVKALAMKASGQTAVSAQEREAYASDQYHEALDAEFAATEAWETLKAKRDAAEIRIDLWRSISARQRGA